MAILAQITAGINDVDEWPRSEKFREACILQKASGDTLSPRHRPLTTSSNDGGEATPRAWGRMDSHTSANRFEPGSSGDVDNNPRSRCDRLPYSTLPPPRGTQSSLVTASRRSEYLRIPWTGRSVSLMRRVYTGSFRT